MALYFFVYLLSEGNVNNTTLTRVAVELLRSAKEDGLFMDFDRSGLYHLVIIDLRRELATFIGQECIKRAQFYHSKCL